MFNLKKVKELKEKLSFLEKLHSETSNYYSKACIDLQKENENLKSQLQVRDSKGRFTKKKK